MKKMSKIQFDVLYMLYEDPYISDEEIARKLFKEKAEISIIRNELIEYGMIKDSSLSQLGRQYFQEHKIDNAIILAAGLSTRFVPLNYERPKGLLEVFGEPLIERDRKSVV